MADSICHFEIIGNDPDKLRRYYAELFGWGYDVGDAATSAVSAAGEYGFLDAATTDGGTNGGVAGGPGYEPRVIFYIGVDDVEAALARAEALGGTRRMGPEGNPGVIVVGHFTDPEGNLVGVAGPK